MSTFGSNLRMQRCISSQKCFRKETMLNTVPIQPHYWRVQKLLTCVHAQSLQNTMHPIVYIEYSDYIGKRPRRNPSKREPYSWLQQTDVNPRSSLQLRLFGYQNIPRAIINIKTSKIISIKYIKGSPEPM